MQMYGRKLVTWLSAVAVILGLTATAVVLAPAALADGGVSRIQISKLQQTFDVSSPSSSTTYRGVGDARDSAVPMTVTFTGTATFTVDGGAPTQLTTGVPSNIAIHTGITSVAITQDSSGTLTTYNIQINRAWLITGFEIYNADDDSVLFSRKVADGNFDPLSRQTINVVIPYAVSRIKWAIFYDEVTEPTAITPPRTLGAWVGYAVSFGGQDALSGEKSEPQTVGSGGTFPVTTQVNDANFGSYPWTQWNVNVSRGSAYTAQSLSSVTIDGVTGLRAADQPYTWGSYISPEKTSVALTANFATGTTSYTINGGTSAPLTSGAAVTIPVVAGTYDLVLTHEAPGGAITTYTYKLARGIAITGFEVANSDTGDILGQFTGANFDVNNRQYYLTARNSVVNYKIRMFFDVPNGFAYQAWIGGINNCPGNSCEPEEWSDPFTVSSGASKNGGPLVMCSVPTACEYGNWQQWSVQITRASAAVASGSVSISGTTTTGQVLTANTSGFSAVPSPTMSYQWQSAGSATGPWTDVPGANTPRLSLPRSLTGKYLQVKVVAQNGYSTSAEATSSSSAMVTAASLAAPTSVTARPGDGTLTVAWAPPIDRDYTDSTVSVTAGANTFTCTGALNCVVNGLTNGTEYTVTVVAHAGVGNGLANSPASSPITATPVVPTAPTMGTVSITGTATTGNRLTANVADLTGTPAPVISYQWQQSSTGAGSWADIDTGTKSTFVVSGWLAGKYIRVIATANTGATPNAVGISAGVGPISASATIRPDFELFPANMSSPKVAVDSFGNMWVFGSGKLAKYAPNATGSDAPLAVWNVSEDGTSIDAEGITIDRNDNVWLAPYGAGRLWMLPAGSRVSDPLIVMAMPPNANNLRSVAADADGFVYIFDDAQSSVRIFAPDFKLGDAPVRKLENLGGWSSAMTIDGNGDIIIVDNQGNLAFYEGGPSGSSTKIRSISSNGCSFDGVTVDTDGRIWASGCGKVRVYDVNAFGSIEPVVTLSDLPNSSRAGMFTNRTNGDVYLASNYPSRVQGWQQDSLNLPPVAVEGPPFMTQVSTTTTGDPAVYSVLTASYGGLIGLPIPTLNGRWQVADSAAGPWSDLAGETATTIELSPIVVGKYVRFAVTVSNINGTNTGASTPVGPVAPVPNGGVVRWIKGDNAELWPLRDIDMTDDGKIVVQNSGNSNELRFFGSSQNGNVAAAQKAPVDLGGGQNGYGVSVAPDGGIWGAYLNTGVAKIAAPTDGVVSPIRRLYLPSPAWRVLEDANGYVYVSTPDNERVSVFAPGANGTDAPIRVLNVKAYGLGIDIDGNLLAAGSYYIRVYEPGASTNDNPIKKVALNPNASGGTAQDLAVDAQKRIWVTVDGVIKIFNPEIQNQSVPVLVKSPDAINKLNNIMSIAVSRTTNGLFAAASEGGGVQVYDWSTIVPAIPPASEPGIASAQIDGDYRIGGNVTATAGTLTGYPDAVLTYQWQRSASSSGPWTDIVSATDVKYVPLLGDNYAYLRVAITATNSEGTDTAYSAGNAKLGHGSVRSPISYIGGSNSPLARGNAIHLLDNGNLLVADNAGKIYEYAAGATFNAAPIREISAAGYAGRSISNVGVNEDGTIWISYDAYRIVKVAAGAGKNATPLQVINPNCWNGSMVEDANGLVYVACYNDAVKVFAADANESSSPVRTIPADWATRSVRLDPAGNIAVPGNGNYRTYAPGGQGTSNTPIFDHALPRYASDVVWMDDHILFATEDGIYAYLADFSDYADGRPALSIYNDGWMSGGPATVTTRDGVLMAAPYDAKYVYSYDWELLKAGDPAQPGSPANVQVTTGDLFVDITWEAATGVVDDYTVTLSGGDQPITCTTTQLTCSLAGMDGIVNGVTYTVTVSARHSWLFTDAGGGQATPNPSYPAPVTNVHALVGDGTFTITWDGSEGEVTNYVVTVTGGVTPLTCTTTFTVCTFDGTGGVVNYLDYSVTVKTVRRSVFATSDPITVSAGIPGKVSGVTATGLNGQIVVNWDAPVGVVTSYTASAVSGANTLTCETTDPSATSCTINGATIGSSYDVSVVAHRGELNGTASDAVEAVVNQEPVISNFTVTGTVQSSKTLRVTGLLVDAFPAATVSYQWQSAATSTGPWIDLADETDLALDLTKQDVGRYVRFVVVATNGLGDDVRRESNVLGPVLNVGGTTDNAGLPIAGFRGDAGNGKVTLSWDRVKGVTAESYTISITAGGRTQTTTVTGATLTKVVTGLVNGTTYSFSVVATGHNETRSKVIEVMPITLLGVVSKVSGVVKATTLTLKWTRPAGTSPVAGYRIVLKSLTKGVKDVEAVSSTPTATIARLAKGASYRVTITGRNALGLGTAYTYATVIKIAK